MKSPYISFPFLIALLMSTNIISAQISGYMGKRIILKYDLFSNLYIPLGENTTYPINKTPTRSNIGIEYVTGRKSTIGLSYGMGNTNFRYSGEFGKLNNTYYNFTITTFAGNNISPIGSFCQFRFSYLKTDYSIRVEDPYWLGDNYIPNQRKLSGSTNNFIFSTVIGNSGVLFNRVIYSFGFQFGYRIGSILGSLLELESNGPDVERYVNKRNSYNELWGIHAGIGILL